MSRCDRRQTYNKQSSGEARATSELVAAKARNKRFVPRSGIKNLGAQVSLAGGSYICYKEDSPGYFTEITCPDVIVLEPGKDG